MLVREKAGGVEQLEGVHVWLRVGDPEAKEKFCRKFENAGFVVTCEYRSDILENKIYLKCPELPDNTETLITNFLNRKDFKIFDWRDDPDYKDSCNDIDAITFQIVK